MGRKHAFQMHFEIWDAEHRTRIEVGPSREQSLNFLEIRSLNTQGVLVSRVMFSQEEARHIIQALQVLVGESDA